MMNERERMLKKENTILIDLVQALVKALSEQMKMHQSLSELQKELFNKELEKCKKEISTPTTGTVINPDESQWTWTGLTTTPNDAGYNWRYNDVCLCIGKIYSENGICQDCGKKVAV